MNLQKKTALCVCSYLVLCSSVLAKETKKLDTMTVTAQKTEQNIQDVPISLTVFDDIGIEDRKIKSTRDIATYTPNFMVFEYESSLAIPIVRGISSDLYALSSGTGMYIDGVPVLNAIGFDEELMDIERIEVLKGPQGSLYGRNTHAGAINIITKQPNNETRGKIGLQLAEDNKRELSLSVSGPIVKDKFYASLSAKHYEKDGFIKNTNLNKFNDDREYRYGKLILRATPNENLDISLTSTKTDKDNGGALTNDKANLKADRTVFSDIDSKNTGDSIMHALSIKYNIGNYELKSTTTYRDTLDEVINDNDFTNIFEKTNNMFRTNTFKNISQEFRISSNTDNLKWLAGIYIDKDDNQLDYKFENYSPYMGSVFKGHNITNLDGESLGLFAHSEYSVNEKLNLITGIRYDKDKRALLETQDSFDPTNQLVDESNKYNSLSPKIGANYKLNQNSSLYTTIAKGYKAGGYYPFSPTDELKKFNKETLISYEIGSKNTFLDGKLVVNGTIYYMDIDDMQVQSPYNYAQAYLSNAAKATSKGFEIDSSFNVNDNITLFGAFGYNDTKFDDFEVDTFDATGAKSGTTNLKGNINPFAPKYNYNLGIQYRDANGYFTRVDLNGYGKTYFDKENTRSRDAYNLVNAKLGYETESYEIYLYGKNIFNKQYDSIGYYGPNNIIYSEPREIGIQLTYRF